MKAKTIRVALLCVGLVVLLSAITFAFNASSVSTKINDKIDSGLREEMVGLHDEFLSAIKNKEYERVKGLFLPQLLETDGFDVISVVQHFNELMNGISFVVSDQYYSSRRFVGNSDKIRIVPSLSDPEKLMVVDLDIPGDEIYSILSVGTNDGFQPLLFLCLTKYEGAWKIGRVDLGGYSLNHETAPQFYEKGKRAKENGRLTSSVVYSWAINKILRPAPPLKYIDESDYVEFTQSTYEEFKDFVQFPVNIDGRQFVGLDVVTTNDAGLLPTLSYVTDKGLSDPAVEAEARSLKEQILKTFPGLDVDFKYILLRAFNEVPEDPAKNYQTYGVVLDLGQ